MRRLELKDVTLDLRICGVESSEPPKEQTTWTLAEAVEDLKARGLVQLLERDPAGDEVTTRLLAFMDRVENGKIPSMGQVLAAYHHAKTAQIWDDWNNRKITARQRAAREGAVNRLVFRPGD